MPTGWWLCCNKVQCPIVNNAELMGLIMGRTTSPLPTLLASREAARPSTFNIAPLLLLPMLLLLKLLLLQMQLCEPQPRGACSSPP